DTEAWGAELQHPALQRALRQSRHLHAVERDRAAVERGFHSMKLALILTLLASAIVLAFPQDKPKTTGDGVYTAAQAKRGEELYSQTCAACHGADLSGADAPALSGSAFNTGWNDLSVADLADRIRTTMPADAPGSLTRQQLVDVVAFLLSKNGFPAGETDL